jgi:hypothetical protein
MARDRKSSPSTKGRVGQKLIKTVAIEAARAVREAKRAAHSNPARHGWLVRHMERQNGRCAYCGIPMFLSPHRGKADCRATLDHVVPLARSGPDSEANTVAACQACNTAKGDLSAQLFRHHPFCIARKKYAAALPPVGPPVKLTVVTVRKRRR